MKRILAAMAFCLPAILPSTSLAASPCETMINDLVSWTQGANSTAGGVTRPPVVKLYAVTLNPTLRYGGFASSYLQPVANASERGFSNSTLKFFYSDRISHKNPPQNFDIASPIVRNLSFGISKGKVYWRYEGNSIPMTCRNGMATGYYDGVQFSLGFEKTYGDPLVQ